MWRWLATYALCACQATLAIPTIEIKGSKFFTSDGDQFYIKGVAYSPNNMQTNNLVDGVQCNIDAPLIKDLGANVVRVYSVDPTLNHDACMKAFEDAGIYVIVDMSTPTYSIKRNDPQWSFELRDAFADVIDGFQLYDNLLAFFAGNEIMNDVDSTTAAPYAKAVVADMKAYRDLMQYRKIPIGYSAADLANLYELQQDYFACGNDSVAADFFAFNKYSWCSPSSFTESGYDAIYKAVDGYDIPVFLSETGCTTNDRKWEDQVAVLGREMNDRFSGNIIYEWSENENGYGIANYSNGVATGTPKLMADYTRLQSQWATLSPTGVKASAYNPSLTKRACPASTSGVWNVRADDALPTLGTSGWTAPTTPRQTGSGSAAAAAASVTAVAKESTPPGPSTESSGVSSGAIAGGVVGGLAGLALILGAVLFLLRRKKKHRKAALAVDSTPGDASGLMVANSSEEKVAQNGYYGPAYQELHGNHRPHELHPRDTNELESQHLREMAEGPEGQPGQPGQQQSEETVHPIPEQPISVEQPRGTPTAAEPSPYVQAQRKMEVDWLEGEEARLRERRALLLKQAGGGGGGT